MELLDMAFDLIRIYQHISRRRKRLDEEFDVYDFDQTWASTALGFGGIGGSALTTARTYVLVPMDEEKAYVYFGGIFAYECDINDRFREDIRKHRMVSVRESGRYATKDEKEE